ncbi:MFS transporter [Natronorubrum sediminis]|nr:MFS transporter [Natronorubrum sediminis]
MDGRGKVLIVVAVGWGLSMGTRMIYPVLLPHLRTAYGIDLTTAGLLVTVLFVAYAIGQLPGGILADRIGERPILIVSTLLAAATLFLVTTAGSVLVLFAMTALFGLAIALYAVARYTVLTRLYPNHLGAANGATAASADAAQSVLPPLAGVLAAGVSWQMGFGFAIPLFLITGLALWAIVPTRTDGTRSSENDRTDGGAPVERPTTNRRWDTFLVLRRPVIVKGAIVYTLGLCIWQAFTAFYPIYMIEIKGLSSSLAGGLFGLFFVLGIAVKPLSGGMYDQIGARRSLLIVVSVSGVALSLLPFVNSFWLLVMITALISALLGISTVVESFLLTNIPKDVRGTGLGIIRSIAFLIGAVSPALFGAAGDRNLFDEAFLSLGLLAGIALVVITLLPEK